MNIYVNVCYKACSGLNCWLNSEQASMYHVPGNIRCASPSSSLARLFSLIVYNRHHGWLSFTPPSLPPSLPPPPPLTLSFFSAGPRHHRCGARTRTGVLGRGRDSGCLHPGVAVHVHEHGGQQAQRFQEAKRGSYQEENSLIQGWLSFCHVQLCLPFLLWWWWWWSCFDVPLGVFRGRG